MKCPKHPERWIDDDLDLGNLNAILECPDCLETFMDQVRKDIESGEAPLVPVGFADRIIARLDEPSYRVELQKNRNKTLTLAHYVAAVAITLAMVLSGSFTLVFQSASDYSTAFNRYVNNVTAATGNVSVQNNVYQDVEDNVNEFIKSMLSHIKKLD